LINAFLHSSVHFLFFPDSEINENTARHVRVDQSLRRKGLPGCSSKLG